MTRTTPLIDYHRDAGARIVDYAGWQMPLQYRGIQAEHQSVRTGAGVFDVSHMGRLYLGGTGSASFLQGLLPVDVEALAVGRMAYAVMCNGDGGVIDDLAVYRLAVDEWLLVVNAARTVADVAWIRTRLGGRGDAVRLEERTAQQAMVAVQGPDAEAVVCTLVGESAAALGFFRCECICIDRGEWLVSRSGYTGEDGFEIICPALQAPGLWAAACSAGAEPAGLAARDTLRLEAGLCLYGHELTEDTSPLEAGLGWTLALDKEEDFSGREALRRQRARGLSRRLVGLRLRERGIPRAGQEVRLDGEPAGSVTSGSHSPVLQCGIGLAYMRSPAVTPGQAVEVIVRDRSLTAEVVHLPFVESRVKRRRRNRHGE